MRRLSRGEGQMPLPAFPAESNLEAASTRARFLRSLTRSVIGDFGILVVEKANCVRSKNDGAFLAGIGTTHHGDVAFLGISSFRVNFGKCFHRGNFLAELDEIDWILMLIGSSNGKSGTAHRTDRSDITRGCFRSSGKGLYSADLKMMRGHLGPDLGEMTAT